MGFFAQFLAGGQNFLREASLGYFGIFGQFLGSAEISAPLYVILNSKKQAKIGLNLHFCKSSFQLFSFTLLTGNKCSLLSTKWFFLNNRVPKECLRAFKQTVSLKKSFKIFEMFPLILSNSGTLSQHVEELLESGKQITYIYPKNKWF